ncbi:MAG: CRISPR-associated endonuclease Cas3'', partial [Bacteroidales bacterium]
MTLVCEHIKAKGAPEYTPLVVHLQQVADVAEKIAPSFGLDADVARKGAILHDIGKASLVFQSRLESKRIPRTVFRHEIASCFFLTLI